MRYPTKISEFVPWVAARAAAWKAAPTTVGLTVAQAGAIDTAAKSLTSAFDEAQKKRQESKNATTSQNEALRDALTLLQLDLRIIDGFAEASSNPAAVYTAAQIDPPPVPQPVAAPGAVSDIAIGLNILTGAPILKWKGNNPGGSTNVSYIIKRKLQGQSSFEFLGVSGSSGPDARSFTDNTLPVGTDAVSYTITATRGSQTGPSTEVQVRFGTVGGSTTFSSVKLAA